MKIVIFGVGKTYHDKKFNISPQDNIEAFLDNDLSLQGKTVDGITVYEPSHIRDMQYDKIVLMSDYAYEMKRQLLNMQVSEETIWTWKRYQCERFRGVLKLFCYHGHHGEHKRRILVLSTYLDYNGGTIAVVHAVMALQSRGYYVVLAAPSGNQEFIEETAGQGVNIVLCPAVYHLDRSEIYWIDQFDVVMVNVFQMLPCACEISKFKPVLWWLHEPSASYSNIYERTRKEFFQYDDISEMKFINIAAVSKIAKRNFEAYYPDRVDNILPYGIPDEYISVAEEKGSDKFTFAIIGAVEEIKAQKIFVQAVLSFAKEELEDLEFLIIGPDQADAYYREVKTLADKVPQINILGRLTREEMKAIYQKIDVVVCASMEECLPTVITEGMMHGKVCITTEMTGMTEYITSGENGFLCKAGDAGSLWNVMKWIAEHRSELQNIRENARETYQNNFSMESFGERLERLMAETEKSYNEMITHQHNLQ